MRTTLTLDPDVVEKLKRRIEDSDVTLQQAVNEALRVGLSAESAKPRERFRVRPWCGGLRPSIDPTRLNQLVDELEVEEFVRKASD